MRRIASVVLLVLVLAMMLSSCVVTSPRSGATSATVSVSKVEAGAAYLSAALTKIRAAVEAAKILAPAKAASIATELEPALEALQQLVDAYVKAVDAQKTTEADAMWASVKTGITQTLGTAAAVLGPQLVKTLGL